MRPTLNPAGVRQVRVPDRVSRDTRPRLAAKARLRFDRKTGRHLLLYPERGLVLNGTATDVLKLCTGADTIADIVTKLAEKYGHDESAVEQEVMSLLNALMERGLIQADP